MRHVKCNVSINLIRQICTKCEFSQNSRLMQSNILLGLKLRQMSINF